MVVLGIRSLAASDGAARTPFAVAPEGWQPSFILPLSEAVAPDFPAFSPATPDDPSSLRLPAAARIDTTKPDGN